MHMITLIIQKAKNKVFRSLMRFFTSYLSAAKDVYSFLGYITLL
jgi:hypothetical protein